jgi:hypothetical protein
MIGSIWNDRKRADAENERFAVRMLNMMGVDPDKE